MNTVMYMRPRVQSREVLKRLGRRRLVGRSALRLLEHAPIVSALVEVGQRLGVSVPRLEMVDALLDALSPSASAKL